MGLRFYCVAKRTWQLRFAVTFDVHANLEAVRGNPTATAIL